MCENLGVSRVFGKIERFLRAFAFGRILKNNLMVRGVLFFENFRVSRGFQFCFKKSESNSGLPGVFIFD